jgi:hypothetical protein
VSRVGKGKGNAMGFFRAINVQNTNINVDILRKPLKLRQQHRSSFTASE